MKMGPKSDTWYFNGIDGTTGEYLTPPMPPQMLSKFVQGQRLDKGEIAELKYWRHQKARKTLEPKEGVNPKDLSQTGWGVIFSQSNKQVDAVREALDELLTLRQEQTGKYYREFRGEEGYRKGESKQAFLSRHGAGPGPADPEKVPYYLLIVADPEQIPYSFQYQLDVQYGVGRIHFPDLADYRNYARSVVAAEKEKFSVPRKAVFFGVANPDDPATELSSQELIQPLAEELKRTQSTWDVGLILRDQATKSRLSDVLGGDQTPAFLFTASHGMGFENGDSRQLPHQGALLCQDWPGPEAATKMPTPDHYFAADDIGSDAKLKGLITFHFACYSAGTPMMDSFAQEAFDQPTAIAPQAFIARLPQRLLAHPQGGALAVAGHVERAWGCSFMWEEAGRQLQTFDSVIRRLMNGHPIGSAFDFLNARYAEISTDLNVELEEISFGKVPDDFALAGMWTANNDARSYVVIGDPAVRLPVL